MQKKRHRRHTAASLDAASEHDVLGEGLYTVPESVRVISQKLRAVSKSMAGDAEVRSLRVNNRLLLTWARRHHELGREYAAISGLPIRIGRQYHFSFPQLIELMTIAALRLKGVKIGTIRAAYIDLRAKYGDLPFAREQFRTDGVGIFSARSKDDGLDEDTVEELSQHQLFFKKVIEKILTDVSYSEGRAIRYNPLGTEKSVILDPRIAMGAPVERRSGVPTAVIYAMHKAQEGVDSIASWYGVSPSGVRDAIEYEDELRKAA